jgi:hypothetical protein
MKKTLNIKKYTKRLHDKNMPLIGYLVWYSLSGRILHDTYEKAFEFAGLPGKYEIKPVQPWQAVRRAVTEFERATDGEGFADLYYNEIDAIKVALVAREEKLDKDRISYTHQTTVVLDKIKGKLKIKGDYEVDTFKKLYRKYREYHNHTDIRRIVIDYLMQKCQAHAVRERGGVYFVPVTFAAEAARLKAFVNKLGGASHFYILPIADSKQGRKEIQKSFSEQMETEIVRYNELLDQSTQRKYRVREMQNHLIEFKKLQKKVGAYEDLLKYKGDDARKAIKMLEKKVKRLLVGGEKRDDEFRAEQLKKKREQAAERRALERQERLDAKRKHNKKRGSKKKVASPKKKRRKK